MLADWKQYPNFTKAEFDCSFSGKNLMTHEFMIKLQALRTEYGKSMTITSGYRDITHPIEAKKAKGGEHTHGNCADIACADSSTRYKLVSMALRHGFTRIGVAKGFIHVGIGAADLPNYVMWDYS